MPAGSDALNSAELYDPASGTFRIMESLNIRRTDHSAGLLRNGQAARAIGGYNENGGNIGYLSSAELFHGSQSQPVGATLIGRAADGRVGTNLPPVHTDPGGL